MVGMAPPAVCVSVVVPLIERRLGRTRTRPLSCATSHNDEASTSSSSSSWRSTERNAKSGEDYLYELGKRSASVSTEVGARKGMVDDVFAGTAHAKFNLGADSQLATGELRYRPDIRSLQNIKIDGSHVPPRFLDRVALHIAKNALVDKNGPWSTLGTTTNNTYPPLKCEVPLLLGIWGPKGCGKSFNVELCLRALNANSVIMSAGELEDELAGVPGRTIRERYRTASRASTNSGSLSCLVINDVDAGAGVFRNTQNTVNSQMVIGTLMNICDHPDRVSVGTEAYRTDDKPLKRVPIIVTGNDLNTLYAPLLRDGRMDKFLWAPEVGELVDIVHATFAELGISKHEAEKLVHHFPEQTSLDFFGAIHARTVDDAVLSWVRETMSYDSSDSNTSNAGRSLNSALFADPRRRQRLQMLDKALSLDHLIAIGRSIATEQQHVIDTKLVEEYMPGVKEFGSAAGAAERQVSIASKKQAVFLQQREIALAKATHSASGASKKAAEEAREALKNASKENPREYIQMLSPAERAERANKRLREVTVAENSGYAGNSNSGGWTILDGGITSEKSVIENSEYDAFDDMDWG